MPADSADDMKNLPFTPRQIEYLDSRFEKFGNQLSEQLSEQLSRKLSEDMARLGEQLSRKLYEDMAHLVNGLIENIQRHIAAIDDQYKDLPRRVTRLERARLPVRVDKLEAAVFPPAKPARRRRG